MLRNADILRDRYLRVQILPLLAISATKPFLGLYHPEGSTKGMSGLRKPGSLKRLDRYHIVLSRGLLLKIIISLE